MGEFEQALVDVFNQCPLPLEAKRYVVLAFFRSVEDAYKSEKEREVREREQVSLKSELAESYNAGN